MATAAGVAGGALLFQGISSLFANNPGPFGAAPGGAAAAAPAAEPAASPWAQASHQGADPVRPADDGGYDQASYDQGSDPQQDYGDDSFDDSGGDDWSNA
jgi:hypothetical protein